ncbi:sensor histidine kinase [uncultured Bacteroides sp.]|uniref:sensor histidine kinase n=1 Tax=uncultured Bacteroides sp. TaxID=162156 RepID=UPI002AAB42CE|nr:sensor histidine kinase [uncultured Bacteroides sp.]
MIENKVYYFSCKPNSRLVLNFDTIVTTPYSTAGNLHGKTEIDSLTNELVYIPQNDYTGHVEFTLSFGNNNNNDNVLDKIIKVQILVANTFKPRARIIKIIGQELISNDVVALVELIKNSFDADSKNIKIQFNDIFSNSGEIIIKDDGCGMSFDKINNVWLEPATPDKKSNSQPTFSSLYGRRMLGEKGIGRFAVHRLGDGIQLITRSKNETSILDDYETIVEIDWTEFTEDKYLDDIPVKVYKNYSPKIFTQTTGTFIKITQINPWKNKKAVLDAAVKIKGLESPIKPKQIQLHNSNISTQNDPGLVIELISNDNSLNVDLNNIKTLSELLDTSFYSFNGIIDEKGNILYEYKFNRPDYQAERRSNVAIYDLKKQNVDWFDTHTLNEIESPGIFEVNFFAWDLDTAALKVAGLSDYYRNIIKPNSGIRVYRDNFRVWPYGEPDDDWLNLDLTRLNAPKERTVSRNQVFGVIHLSSITNPCLKDQSNREGLIVSPQYEQFYKLVSASLNLFATERKKDKIKIEKILTKKGVSDIVTDSINNVRLKINKNNHSNLYSSDIDNIEKKYTEKVNDILERYMMAAAIGISYSIPIHEMKLRLTSIKHVIEDIEKNPLLQDKYLRLLSTYVKETEDIVRAVTSIMSKQKKQTVDLVKVARNVCILKESELNKYNINYNISSDKEFLAEIVPGLFNTAILNIVDNSIYWLRAKKHQLRQSLLEFQPQIDISFGYNDVGRKYMRISDNGNGFEDPFELLVEPYYSRKEDGLGLGLYLVNEIVIRNGANLVGYNDNGAVIDIIF